MQQKQILIVEDDEIYRGLLRRILSEHYRVLEAGNGQEALDVLGQSGNDVSLIILDVMMPVMDGYTFLDIARKDEAFSMIPVIVVTQGDTENDEILALEHGANDFISKPYRAQVILHRVENLITMWENAAMVNQLRFDPLTGLYTKEFFYQVVREVLDANPDKEYNILCCNLENFKLYNDTFGRKAGDSLLIEEAAVLRKRVGEKTICCRYVADRFLCLIDRQSEKKGRETFAEARKNRIFALDGKMSCKLGIYEITDRSVSVEQMCDRALLVVDSIKGIYDRHVAVYEDTLRNKLLREKAITDCMEQALLERQFTVYYQPKHSLNDDCLVGAEALVRWIHPQWGFMSPGEFIPLFEKNGFIRRLDEYVWDCVCKQLSIWKEKGYPAIPISVNVSRADIFQSDLVGLFCGLVTKYRIDPSCLHLEITESAYTETPEQIVRTVEELRKQGFIIEMDDFGSGYSSLNMFSQMSLDVLKLDMSFIRNELAKSVEQSILNDIINMAHRVRLNVVAEGVETQDQKNRLQIMGCDYAQGYYYAKPMAAEEFEVLLQKHKEILEEMAKDTVPVTHSHSLRQIDREFRTVLVIEDDEISRFLLKDILCEQYHVLTAENGREGLEVLREHAQEISVILLDIQMPIMNGYEFLKLVSNDSVFCKIPVIVTTVWGSTKEEKKCLALGATDFIAKPYNAELILMRLGNLVRLRECDSIISALEIDVLTGFKNRKAYYEDIEAIENDPVQSSLPVGVIFADINGLKVINDTMGHEAGDQLIADTARAVRRAFPEANIYRLGGDEFVVLTFEKDEAAFHRKIAYLKEILDEGKSAAVGSVWVQQARDIESHVAVADRLMYCNKSFFYERQNQERRSGLQFGSQEVLQKMEEISEVLPGGFFVYKADETEEILSINFELMRMYECDTEEQFRTFTGNSFRGMVHPQDLNRVEGNISSQIEKENDIDYVEYRIVTAKGTVKTVRDYGRFVHTQLYGDVYYVLVNDI